MRSFSAMRFLVLILVLSTASFAQAAVKLPGIFGNNMVVQQGEKVPVWGWAGNGEEVTITLLGQERRAKADEQGKWKVRFDEIVSGKPFDITITTSNDKKVISNVVAGEVWVCSGQSNMEMGVGVAKDAQKEIAAANYPNIRLFTVERANVPAANHRLQR